MATPANKTQHSNVSVDTTGMSPTQVRLLKSLMAMMKHVSTTNSESEFFDGSAEALRICASLIKQSKFVETFKADEIPYAEQALEYSIDVLQDHMTAKKVVTYDC